MKTLLGAAFVAMWIVVAPAMGQVVIPEQPLFQCGTSQEIPDGPPRVIDYRMVEAPAGSTIEIGVLFLYTDHFTASQVRRRTADWIETANELFDAGTSGIRLRRVGVKAAPRSVSRLALNDPISNVEDLRPVLNKVVSLHEDLVDIRRETGADIVTVVAPGPWGAIAAGTWLKGDSERVARRKSYNIIGTGGDPYYLSMRATRWLTRSATTWGCSMIATR